MNVSIRPVITEIVEGWLATTPPDHPLRIGVVGDSIQQAEDALLRALEKWSELLARPDPLVAVAVLDALTTESRNDGP